MVRSCLPYIALVIVLGAACGDDRREADESDDGDAGSTSGGSEGTGGNAATSGTGEVGGGSGAGGRGGMGGNGTGGEDSGGGSGGSEDGGDSGGGSDSVGGTSGASGNETGGNETGGSAGTGGTAGGGTGGAAGLAGSGGSGISGGGGIGGSGIGIKACCVPENGSCNDAGVRACVCAVDNSCCSGWNNRCAWEVESEGCDTCTAAPFSTEDGGYVNAAPWRGYAFTATESPSLGSRMQPTTFTVHQAGDPFCALGEVATQPAAYGLLGFNLNQNISGMPGGGLPWTPSGNGVHFNVDNLGRLPLQIQLRAAGSQTWCKALDDFFNRATNYIPWSAFNTNCTDGSGTAYDGTPLLAIAVVAPYEPDTPTDISFNFCILNLAPY